jgi:hypothetical protein
MYHISFIVEPGPFFLENICAHYNKPDIVCGGAYLFFIPIFKIPCP